VPSANTLVRWVNENAFAFIVQARPCPTFGRPVHLRGGPHRLQPGTSPHALRIPPRDGHPALQSAAQEGGSRSALAVSRFRLRARVGLFIPSFFLRPARHYPRFWIWHPSSGRQRDFNPPEQRAAQRTLWTRKTSPLPMPAPPVSLGSRRLRLRVVRFCRGQPSPPADQVPFGLGGTNCPVCAEAGSSPGFTGNPFESMPRARDSGDPGPTSHGGCPDAAFRQANGVGIATKKRFRS
jgi:hypothetical protein